MDCTVFFWLGSVDGRSVTEDADTCAATTSTGECKTGGVSCDAENCVTGAETNGCIRMGGEAVEEMITGLARFGLVVGNFVESWESSAVESAAAAEKSTGNFWSR